MHMEHIKEDQIGTRSLIQIRDNEDNLSRTYLDHYTNNPMLYITMSVVRERV